MSVTDGQNDATTNATNDAKDDVAGGNLVLPGKHIAAQGSDSSAVAVPAAVTVVSGTAMQPNTKQDTMLYIDVTTSASLKVEIGSTSAAATTLYAAASAALGLMTVRVPKGFYIKITGTVADFAIEQIPC